jgi:glycosyltransferase involved in cell wall biosynthesis
MKVLHISISDGGGAGVAAVRLHEALLGRGVDSKLLTLQKNSDSIQEHYLFSKVDAARFRSVSIVMSYVDRILKRFKLKSDYYRTQWRDSMDGRPKGHRLFNFTISEYHLEMHPLVKEADIIHLHWVCGGFLDFKGFFTKVSKKVVWTLHDMNPFTGGCHYANECDGYMKDCHTCPQLEGTADLYIAKKMLSQKIKVLNDRREGLSIVTPSKWLMECSRQSALFGSYKHQHIYNVVAAEECYLTNKAASRNNLSIPLDKKVVLCIASFTDLRKGNMLLLGALDLMAEKNVLLCSVGGMTDELKDNSSVLQLGYIKDRSKMRDIYNAADVFVLPSMADNFPNTVVESLRCGTPVVAFNVGGIPEQITEHNGILVEERSEQSLAAALDKFFGNQHAYNREAISKEASDRYDVDGVVSEHLDLYRSLEVDSSSVDAVN